MSGTGGAKPPLGGGPKHIGASRLSGGSPPGAAAAAFAAAMAAETAAAPPALDALSAGMSASDGQASMLTGIPVGMLISLHLLVS